ncbi:MAG TPA: DnaJ domain-containing protein, partial [Blastocatellia bacterium]|nr:DnaJ domain-containing protein [Blastocatellia bacterium]
GDAANRGGRRDPRPRRRVEARAKPVSRMPHEVLGIDASASRAEIAEAFRDMAMMYHPDKVASLAPEFRDLAERRMKEISAAYTELMKSR